MEPPELLSAAQNSLASYASDDLPEALRAHLPAAETNAHRNIQLAERQASAALRQHDGLLRTVHAPSTSKTSRVMMLRHIAAQWSGALVPHSACRSGCAHCCHIAVTISETEAKLISKQIGRALRQPVRPVDIDQGPDTEQPYGYEHPCTFLHAGRCSIYEHRPLTCRTLVNMDDISVLCELVPGVSVPVPYANSSGLQGRLVLATRTDVFADIRDWFPG